MQKQEGASDDVRLCFLQRRKVQKYSQFLLQRMLLQQLLHLRIKLNKNSKRKAPIVKQ